MRKYIFAIFFLCLSATIDKPFAQKTVPKSPNTVPTAQVTKLQNKADSLQYSLGAFLASWVVNNGFTINNAALFSRGFDDVLQNRPRLIPDSTIAPGIAAYQELAQKALAAQQELQLFSSLKDKPGIGSFPNGVKYLILKTGKGVRPSETDSIVLHMVAKLPNGTVVEDTYKTQQPFNTRPAAFFPGLNDALQNMPAGSKWTLYVPAVLAYNDKGTAQIPPNSALVLEVELVEVRPSKK